MPFNPSLKAKTSKDGNCGLHCFVPTVAAIFNEGTHIAEKDRMALAFKAYYKINGDFSRDTLRNIIQNTSNPLEREALLAPVLRQMMVDRMRRSNAAVDPFKPTDEYIAKISQANTALFSHDLLYLADDLGISLEAYDPQNNSIDSLRDRKNNLLAFPAKVYPCPVLKIKNDSTHWEFEMDCGKTVAENKQMLDAHNAQYHDNLLRFNDEALRARVKTEVEKGHTRLSSIFAEADIAVKTVSKAAANDTFGGFASKMGGFVQNLFGGSTATAIKETIGGIASKAGDFMKGISGALPAIKNTIGGITSGVSNVVKTLFGGSGSKPGQMEDMFSGLVKMITDLFKTIMGLFGQAAPKAKAEAQAPKPSVTNTAKAANANSQAMSSAGAVLAQRFQDSVNKWNQEGAARGAVAVAAAAAAAPDLSSGHQSAQVPPVHLAQFERTRAEALRSRAANASSSADLSAEASTYALR